jgi:hypothetical protein
VLFVVSLTDLVMRSFGSTEYTSISMKKIDWKSLFTKAMAGT